MNHPPPRPGDLELRLARLIGTLDATPGFEARLAARLAHEHPLLGPAARAAARARLERERGAAQRALRRHLGSSLLLVAGAAIAAVGPALLGARLLVGALRALPVDGGTVLAVVSVAAFAGWVAAVLARTARGQRATALFT
jgi:hypothetical protein